MGTRPLTLALGGIALIAAAWAGLARLSFVPLLPGTDAGVHHGALFVSGFIGTVIGLERAFVARHRWALLAPALSAAGALGVLLGVPAPYPALAIVVAALALLAVCLIGAPASPSFSMGLMAAGALAWAVGAVLWAAGEAAFRSVPWWIAFLVLAIAAERLELSQALRPSGVGTAFVMLPALALTAGLVTTLVDFAPGVRLAGAALLLLALWLLLFDRTPAATHDTPLSRFISVAIVLAYAWLAAGSVLLLTYDGIPAGWRYDAMLHAVLVGFVLSMIFAHAPIVAPAIVGLAVSYRPGLYAALVLLQLSLFVRLLADVAGSAEWRGGSGLLTALAMATLLGTIARGAHRRRPATRYALAAAGLRH